jgi:hypothetical protein
MFGIIGHRDRLVDEKYGDAVLDAIRAPEPSVVEVLVVDQQQRPAVFRADEDAQQLVVEHR